MARGLGKVQRTIKALVARDLAVRQIESESITSTGAKLLGSFLASAAFAIVLDAIWCYFAVSGLVHMGSARVILIFAWAVGTVGIVISDWIWGKPFVHRVRLGILASVILGIMLIGLDAWTIRHRPSEVHPIAWADFPASLVNRIADAVYNRIAPLFPKQASQSPPNKSATHPQPTDHSGAYIGVVPSSLLNGIQRLFIVNVYGGDAYFHDVEITFFDNEKAQGV